MKRAIVLAVDAAVAALLVTGCATNGLSQAHIEPLVRLTHGGPQADGYYQLGRFLQEQQRLDDAAAAYRKALALDPKHADAHNGLGTVFALRGEFGAAHASFAAALAQAPENPAVLNNIGFALLLERRPGEALEPLTRATELAPENPRYSSNLVLALNSQSPGSAEAPAAQAAPATIDAAAAPTPAAGSSVFTTLGEAEPVRLVPVGPHAFELVVPKPVAPPPAVALLPTSHGRMGVEVSNGHGASGMARRVSRQLGSAGIPVRRLTNQLPYGGSGSRVEYRPGHERAALDLSWRVPGRPPIVASIGLRADIDVRLVLGRELPARVVLVPPTEQVAHYEAASPD